MTESDKKIEQVLSQMQSEGRYSLVGQSWMEFDDFLSTHQTYTSIEPPVPLILASSGELNGTKRYRLRDPLKWAARHGLLPAALIWLDRLPFSEWNSCAHAISNKTNHAWN